jgi:hypothetical protein
MWSGETGRSGPKGDVTTRLTALGHRLNPAACTRKDRNQQQQTTFPTQLIIV